MDYHEHEISTIRTNQPLKQQQQQQPQKNFSIFKCFADCFISYEKEQQLADEHGYTHGVGARFIDKHVVHPMRTNHDKDNPPDSTAT
ncbi:unnamed protein product [Rotaria sp. Silwood1]|nr:unnamed protein product [Rotaria sp. Silwood1]